MDGTPATPKRWLGLGAQVSAVVCALVIVSTVTVGLLTYYRFGEALTRRELAQLSEAARDAADDYVGRVEAVREDLRFLAGMPSVVGLVRSRTGAGTTAHAELWRGRLEGIFIQLLRTRPNYLQARFVELEGGRELVEVRQEDGTIEVAAEAELETQGARDYLREAAQAPPGRVTSFPASVRALEGGRTRSRMRTAIRVDTATGDPFGLVLVDVDVGHLIGAMRASVASGLRLYVANAEGELLYVEGGAGVTSPRWLADSFPAVAEAAKLAPNEATVVQGGPEPVAVGLASVAPDPARPGRTLRFLVAGSYRDVVAASRALRNEVLALAGMFLLLALAAGLALSRSLTEPLRRIGGAVRAFGEGRNEELVLPRHASAELVALTESLRSMVRQVEERTHALEAEVAGRRRAEEHQRGVVEASPAAILTVDTEGIVRLVNSEAERLFGESRAALVGMPMEALMPARCHPTIQRAHDEVIAAGEHGPRTLGRDERLAALRADGREVPVELTISPIELPEGRQVLALILDVSERRSAEDALYQKTQELELKTAELERSNRDLERFGYIVSHDLREPLRMVSSFLGLLKRRYAGQLDERADEFIHYAVEGAERMQTLLSDLLRYSRVGRGGEGPERVDLNAVLDAVRTDLAQAIEESHAEITSDELPQVWAYETELLQLFQNLIANALKYRGEEPPRIEVRVKRRDAYWELCVADNGIGFDPQYAERIFEVFQRLHTLREYPGTGIGLAIAKRVVEHHGGQIWVESQPGQGATFRFTLPATHAGLPADLPAPEA